MKVVGKITEPVFGYEQEVAVIPEEELEVIEIQRKPSSHHVRRLVESMRKIGFVSPLVVVRRDERLIVIDGQHRLLAARELGIKEIPCIIIPDRYSFDLMELNVEKQMSLRERAYVALNVYRMYLEKDGSVYEDDGKIIDSIEFAYYVTLGIGYERNDRLFGSAYETLLRRLDRFLPMPLSEAISVRERRASIVLEVDSIAREAVERVKEIGISHPFLHKEVISFSNPIGRRRKVEESFEEVFEELRANLERLVANPEEIRAHKFSDEFEV